MIIVLTLDLKMIIPKDRIWGKLKTALVCPQSSVPSPGSLCPSCAPSPSPPPPHAAFLHPSYLVSQALCFPLLSGGFALLTRVSVSGLLSCQACRNSQQSTLLALDQTARAPGAEALRRGEDAGALRALAARPAEPRVTNAVSPSVCPRLSVSSSTWCAPWRSPCAPPSCSGSSSLWARKGSCMWLTRF